MSSTPTPLLAATFGAVREGALFQTDRAVMAASIQCLRRFRISSRLVRTVPDDLASGLQPAMLDEPW